MNLSKDGKGKIKVKVNATEKRKALKCRRERKCGTTKEVKCNKIGTWVTTTTLK